MKKTKKLSLDRQSIRVLSDRGAKRAAGGILFPDRPPTGWDCPTADCFTVGGCPISCTPYCGE